MFGINRATIFLAFDWRSTLPSHHPTPAPGSGLSRRHERSLDDPTRVHVGGTHASEHRASIQARERTPSTGQRSEVRCMHARLENGAAATAATLAALVLTVAPTPAVAETFVQDDTSPTTELVVQNDDTDGPGRNAKVRVDRARCSWTTPRRLTGRKPPLSDALTALERTPGGSCGSSPGTGRSTRAWTAVHTSRRTGRRSS